MNKQKQFGEVLSPKKLVNEMLDLFSEKWSLDKTYLDPCAGRNAIFSIEIFKRTIKDNIDEYDYKYISDKFWNDCMYMVELQEDAYEQAIKNIEYFIKVGGEDLEKMMDMDPNETYEFL